MNTGAGFSCYFFWIASMASITAARRPPRSSAATPTMVVPPGEHTASFIAAGCWPLSTEQLPRTRYHLPCQAVGRTPGQAVQHRGIIQRFVKSPKKKPARRGYGSRFFFLLLFLDSVDGVDHRRPQAAAFQRRYAHNGGTARGAHRVFHRGGMLSAFYQQLPGPLPARRSLM